MKRKSDFFDIDPIFSSLDELIPIAENTINAAIAESNGHISRDQLQIAIIAGLSAFISTLGHGGAFDQGEKAAITIGKSLPHIIVAANKVNKEYANPKDRIFHMLRTAAGLLSRAATSTLSGFLPEKRADIGKDIEIPILLVSSYANKKRKMKGSGKINITPSFEIGVSWLYPASGITGGGIFDTISDWWTGNGAKRERLQQMQEPMPEQNLTPGDVSPLDQLNLTNSIIPDPDAPGLLDKLGNVRVLTSALSTGANIVAGAATGNPLFWVNAVAGSLPIINALLPIAGGLGSRIVKHTYGKWIRDRVAANPERWPRYSSLIRNVDSFTNDVSNWWNTKEQKKLRKQLMLTAETMVPAIAQDYMYNKQRKAAWDANVERERTLHLFKKAEHEAAEKDANAEIDRANAVLAEDIRMERRKLEVKNSNILANEAQDMADYEDMVKHNDVTNEIRALNANTKRIAEIAKLRYDAIKDLSKMSDETIKGLADGVASLLTANPRGTLKGLGGAAATYFGSTRNQLQHAVDYYNRALEQKQAGNYEGARREFEAGLKTQFAANEKIEKTIDDSMDRKWEFFAKKHKLSKEDIETLRDITDIGEEGNRVIDELVFSGLYGPSDMYDLKQALKNAEPWERESMIEAYKELMQPRSLADIAANKINNAIDETYRTVDPYMPGYIIPEGVGPVKRPRFQETYPLPNEIVNSTDPRLRQHKTHVKYPDFVEPAPPVDLYGMPYTQKAIAELPNIIRVYGNEEDDDAKKIYHHDLQYVSPMKKADVSPGPHNYKSATPLRTIPIIHQKRLTQFKPFTPSGLTFLKSAPSAIPHVNLKRLPRVNLKRSRTFSRKT